MKSLDNENHQMKCLMRVTELDQITPRTSDRSAKSLQPSVAEQETKTYHYG
jgi:hypothetical protein